MAHIKSDLEKAHEGRKRAVDEFLARLAEKQRALLAAQDECETMLTEHKNKLADVAAEALRARSAHEKEVTDLQYMTRGLRAKADMAPK